VTRFKQPNILSDIFISIFQTIVVVIEAVLFAGFERRPVCKIPILRRPIRGILSFSARRSDAVDLEKIRARDSVSRSPLTLPFVAKQSAPLAPHMEAVRPATGPKENF
jgi:hypothetical protein